MRHLPRDKRNKQDMRRNLEKASAMMTLESTEDLTAEEGFSAAELDRIAEQFDPPSQALT
jgi:hypothetical protein